VIDVGSGMMRNFESLVSSLAVLGLLYVAKIADQTAKQIRERKLRMKSQKVERS
jgi:hypothetical protein